MSSVVITMGSGTSRAAKPHCWNDDPVFCSILYDHVEKTANAVETVANETATRMLALFRAEVAKYRTQHHRIVISAAMGSCGVRVEARNGRRFTLPDRGWAIGYSWTGSQFEPPLIRALEHINAALDYDWAYLLDGAELNPVA